MTNDTNNDQQTIVQDGSAQETFNVGQVTELQATKKQKARKYFTVVGNLGTNLELQYTPKGTPVCNGFFVIDFEDNDYREQSEGVAIKGWAGVGQAMFSTLCIGDFVKVLVELKEDSYENNDGKTIDTTHFVVRRFKKLASSKRQAKLAKDEAFSYLRGRSDLRQREKASNAIPMPEGTPFNQTQTVQA